MSDLILFHGGLSEPVCCAVPEEELSAAREEAASLTAVPVSDADLSTVYRWGDGGLTPLSGPMDQATFNQVLEHSYIVSGGKRYAWTIPLSLPVTESQAQGLKPGQKVALTSAKGEIVATLDITDVFPWDKAKYLKAVYLTDRTDHPGADMALVHDADKTWLLGGTIHVFPQQKNAAFGQYILSPKETRALISQKGWNRVVAFQTRNPLHRAHEYALVYGLETLLKQGYNAGACLNPLVGETKGDDVNAEIRMQTYEMLIKNRSLGEGDSDHELWSKLGEAVPDRVILLGLDIKMFYGGPKEAVMHAIYRQNFGFTDLIIGRKHADAPYKDGTAIWGDFDAQEIFEHLEGELLEKPLKVGFAAYYESLGRVDLMEFHKEEKPVFISGKEVRATLQRGEHVDPRIMRPSTSEILAFHMKKN
ncbi:MAG: sulfate adenylyltransferase [Planctomycetia bacterium]|nr:sulfate adenylyltransferase [Planctomycetia bacterium]